MIVKEVVENCDRVLALDHNNVKAFLRRAKAREQLGDFAQAVTDIQRCLQVFQNNARGDENDNGRVVHQYAL